MKYWTGKLRKSKTESNCFLCGAGWSRGNSGSPFIKMKLKGIILQRILRTFQPSLLTFAKVTLLALIALFYSSVSSADQITPNEAKAHIGKNVTVVGKVVQVSRSKGGTTFINFGGRFPNHSFYAVIFKNRTSLFKNIFALEGETVGISGTISLYRGKPQIILVSPNQISY